MSAPNASAVLAYAAQRLRPARHDLAAAAVNLPPGRTRDVVEAALGRVQRAQEALRVEAEYLARVGE